MAQFDPKGLDYVLPKSVEALLEQRYKTSTAMATTAALFVVALMSLAQLAAASESQSSAWEALRFFIYVAIGSNIITVACSLWTISGVAEVPSNAQWVAMNSVKSWPYKHAARLPLPATVSIREEYELLTNFGMETHYRWQILGAGVWYLVGLFSTFLALDIWLWVSQSTGVAAAVTVVLIPGCAAVVAPLFSIGLSSL